LAEVRKDSEGANWLHYAAWSGSVPAIAFVLQHAPRLKGSKIYMGANFLHYAAWSGSNAAFQFILEQYPALAASLWVEDIVGHSLHYYALRSKTNLSPRKILRQLLQNATDALCAEPSSTASDKQLELIEAFQTDWRQGLIAHDILFPPDKIPVLLQNRRLSQRCRDLLKQLHPLLQLHAILTEDQLLTLPLLRQLIHSAQAVLSQNPIGLFQHIPQSKLLTALIHLTQALEKEGNAIEPVDAILVASIIIDDYQRASPQKDTADIDRALISKLLATTSMRNLRPRPVLTQGRDIGPHNFMTHFENMKKVFETLAVSAETQRIIHETLFPGIHHLLTQEAQIIEHIRTRFAVLYYLDDHNKLPMHTDIHREDDEANRLFLRLVKTNLFAAFYLAQEAGKAGEFFTHLTYGFCFDGRVNDVLAWAAQFSEAKSFNDFMEEHIREYLVYRRVLFGETREEAEKIEPASAFIISRFNRFPCQVDPQCAPNAVITQRGVEQYLKDVLCYDHVKQSVEENPPSCIIS